MKRSLTLALTLAATCAGTALADTISFQGNNTTLGHSETYTSAGGAISVKAYGFNTDGTNRKLYGKNEGGSENGVGISGNNDNEIDKFSFVQLDVSSLTTPYSLSIGSTQDREGFSVYFSNSLGSLGTLAHDFMHPTKDPFSTGLLSTPAGDRFVSIIADGNPGGAGNVLLDSLTTSAVTPEPNSLMLLGTGALGLIGVVRKRLAV